MKSLISAFLFLAFSVQASHAQTANLVPCDQIQTIRMKLQTELHNYRDAEAVAVKAAESFLYVGLLHSTLGGVGAFAMLETFEDAVISGRWVIFGVGTFLAVGTTFIAAESVWYFIKVGRHAHELGERYKADAANLKASALACRTAGTRF